MITILSSFVQSRFFPKQRVFFQNHEKMWKQTSRFGLVGQKRFIMSLLLFFKAPCRELEILQQGFEGALCTPRICCPSGPAPSTSAAILSYSKQNACFWKNKRVFWKKNWFFRKTRFWKRVSASMVIYHTHTPTNICIKRTIWLQFQRKKQTSKIVSCIKKMQC